MAHMTDVQFKKLTDKLDRIITLLEAQQGKAGNLVAPFEWTGETVVPPFQFDGQIQSSPPVSSNYSLTEAHNATI